MWPYASIDCVVSGEGHNFESMLEKGIGMSVFTDVLNIQNVFTVQIKSALIHYLLFVLNLDYGRIYKLIQIIKYY